MAPNKESTDLTVAQTAAVVGMAGGRSLSPRDPDWALGTSQRTPLPDALPPWGRWSPLGPGPRCEV